MIYKQINPDIKNKQTEELKEENAKIIKHLEQGFPLRADVLENMKAILSNIINSTREFTDVLKKINNSGDYFVIQLLHHDNEILNLPWIMAIDKISSQPLGNIQQLILTKCLPDFVEDVKKPKPAELAPPLKILIMISSPEVVDYKGRLSYEDEEFQILQAFYPLLRKGQVQIDFTDDGSLEALETKIKKNRYHVLHYSGHASFIDGTGVLDLENPLDLTLNRVSAKEFADTLNCNPDYKIPLVALASCQSAQGSNEEGLRGITNHLLRTGISAVISMGMAVLDKYATEFSAHFYAQIAKKQNILVAFNSAVTHMKEQEYKDQINAKVKTPQPLQWIIPNIYLSKNIEHLVDWDSPQEKLELSSYRFIYEKDRLLLKHDKDYIFIGRRLDKARIMPPFFAKKPVLLKGMGGVGKTAMSEHMVQRLIASYPKTEPFVFNEKIKSFQDIQNQLQEFLKKKSKFNSKEFGLCDKGMDQLMYLVGQTASVCRPVFIFDNLETFQKGPGTEISEEYQDIKDVIDFLIRVQNHYVILTSRYPLPDFKGIASFDLNQVGFNDFWKKCHNLELYGIVEHIQKLQNENQPSFQKKLEFVDIAKDLHQSFGGNYRALEFFNELFKNDPGKIRHALDSLETFRKKYAKETEQVKMKMSQNILIGELFNLLNPKHQVMLGLLSNFQIPVQQFALQLQIQDAEDLKDIEDILSYLNDLTLIEISLNPEIDKVYFYCTSIVKDILTDADINIPSADFSHKQAGIYHYHCFENIENSITELEQAFFHFEGANIKNRTGSIGDMLSSHYYAYSLYQNSYYYAMKVYHLLGKGTDASVLNRLGLLLHLYGNYEDALEFFNTTLLKYGEIGDKSGQGTTLNNISQIYNARGDYETALKYLEDSLKIRQEIGDKSGQGTTLNNISQIYDARGDYETALKYLEDSLKISQEIGDKSGQGTTLNNIGSNYYTRGDYETALKYLEDSLKIRQEIGDKSGQGTTLNNISQIYDARGDYETALKYLEDSLKIRQEIGYKSGQGTTLSNIGSNYYTRGDYKTALKYLEDSLKISQEIGDKSGQIITLHNMAMIAIKKNDYQKFVEYESTAYKLAAETGDAMGLYHVGLALGQFLYVNGNKEEGRQILIRSYEIGRQANFADIKSVEKMLKEMGVL
ncbi:MAG: tetratricopeptide repeat protein [Spirochaetota bacterium]|nr:tetratricopeptide repeat protein [Spirochaetota bacterium]